MRALAGSGAAIGLAGDTGEFFTVCDQPFGMPGHTQLHISRVYASTENWTKTHRAQQHELDAKAEHLRLILSQAHFVFLGNLAASLTFMIGSMNRISTTSLAVWGTAIIGFGAARLLYGRGFPSGQLSRQVIDNWEKRFLLSTLISGALWGLAGGLFYLPGQMDHNFFIAILIIGMSAAATTSHSYHRIAYPVFFLPAIAPLIFNLWSEPTSSAKAIAWVTPFYFLLMYLSSQRIYQAAHVAILSGFANRYHATHDYLTGIANRRAFQDALDQEWARALRTQKPLSLCIADIDDFKHYNDVFGHAAGDEVLQVVARSIHDRVRYGMDLAARIGGEEFAVILPETSLSDAHSVAESIKTRVHELELKIGENALSATLSIGVSTLVPTAEADSSKLYNSADRALYSAKHQGKNRVVAASCT